MLKAGGDGGLADVIRKAIGVGPNEKVQVTTPQFTRPEHWPKPGAPPKTPAEWWNLWGMPKAKLRKLGLGNWDGRLMLFPGEWYAHIPKGFVIESINGKRQKFVPGKTDNDIRFSCLPYGVAAQDGVVEDDE